MDRLRSEQELFSAVRSGDLDALMLLLDSSPPPPVGTTNAAGETMLYVAAEANQEDVFRYLLGMFDYDTAIVRSKKGITAFHVAAQKGNAGVVKEFLAKWPEVCKLCDGTNTSPLYSAAEMNHLDVVNAILDVDESTIRNVRKNGKTALHRAVRVGHHQIVKALVEKDPEIIPRVDKKGQTALHMAVKGKHSSTSDIVMDILCGDISVLNARDKKGNTPLHVATRKWHSEMVHILLSHRDIEVNALNKNNETAMDLAEKCTYGDHYLDMIESLSEAGGKHARDVGRLDEASELRRTVSDIKHNVQTQLIQNAKTNKHMSGIAKEVRKLHREAVQNTINSVTVVAVLIASIAFIAIFNLPGQYQQDGKDVGKSNVADTTGFKIFCLLNATALFISLAVVVVQITLVAWETGAQKRVVAVVNKLMWAACISTLGAFLSLAFVVVGKDSLWMAITITVIGVPIMVGTLGSLCYLVYQQHFKSNDDSQRNIKRGSGSKSFSMSLHSALSDPDALYSKKCINK